MDAVPLRAVAPGRYAVLCPSCGREGTCSDGVSWSCACGASGRLPGGGDAGEAELPAPGVLGAAARWYAERLFSPAGAWVRAYLVSRGVSLDAARRFGLGYAPPGPEQFRAMQAWGSVSDLAAAGLLVRDRGLYRLRFRDRVVFPVRDSRGCVLGFAGRALGPSSCKWVNTSGLRKSRVLYGLDLLSPGAGPVLLVEGYLDVVVLFSRGWAVVGAMGTSLSGAQADLLAGLGREVVVLYDPDEPGRRAACRAVRMLASRGVAARVGLLPEGRDPDELALSGRLASVVEAAVPGWEFRMAEESAGLPREEAVEILASVAAEASGGRERDLRLARAQALLGAS